MVDFIENNIKKRQFATFWCLTSVLFAVLSIKLDDFFNNIMVVASFIIFCYYNFSSNDDEQTPTKKKIS